MSEKEYYTSVTQRFGKILYRGYSVDAVGVKKRISGRLAFKPTLYLETKQETALKSLYGVPLVEKKFDSMSIAREYVKQYKDVQSIYGYAPGRFEYEFIARSFSTPIEVGIEDLNVISLDIETTTELGGFPNTRTTPETITLITLQNIKTKKLETFGILDTKHENYIKFNTEAELLEAVLIWFEQNDPDILTGWNVEGFDFPYLINRINLVLGEDSANRLSPFGQVDCKEKTFNGKPVQIFTIVGRSIIDLLEAYKKFTFVKREKYSLDAISKIELGAGKLENPYSTFREFYLKDPEKFVKYNQIDTIRVSELEDRLGLISLIIGVAYLTKSNINDVFSPVKYWTNYITATLLNEFTYCNVTKDGESEDGELEGAYVMEPIIGFHGWPLSIDGTALYPSIIEGLNCSPETIVDVDLDCSVDALLSGKVNYSGTEYSVGANGARFRKDIKGVLPRLVAGVLAGRSIAKNIMLKAKQDYQDTHDEKYKKLSNLNHTLQLAWKVMANSLYGICGNEYFIFYDFRIASAITHTGQYILKSIGNHANIRFNEFFKTTKHNYLIYGDTDSLYLGLGSVVDKYFGGKSDLQITAALDKLFEGSLRKYINEATDIIAETQNYYKKTITFKRESIASAGIWLGKKKYALKVYNNEGVQYNEGDYKFTGLEVVRSSTPEIARESLKACVILVIDKKLDELKIAVAKAKEHFMSAPIESIAFPRGINNLLQYSSDTNIYNKGAPIQVRAALLHNYYVSKLGIEKTVNFLQEGDKIRFIYLKMPNHFKENVIAFSDTLPNEFKLEKYIDRELQFEKVFMAPLNGIMTAVGWELEEKTSLDDFFC